MKFLKTLFALSFLAMCIPSQNQAQEKSSGQEWRFVVKGGMVTPGTVSVHEIGDFDTDTGWIVGLDAETMVASKLSMGGFFLHSNVSEKISGESANVNTFGGTLKGCFAQSNGVQIRPGLAIGYQLTSGTGFEDVKGLDIAFVLDVAFPTQKGNAIIGEVSFLSQPAGGNKDSDVTFAPIIYLALGYQFGK